MAVDPWEAPAGSLECTLVAKSPPSAVSRPLTGAPRTNEPVPPRAPPYHLPDLRHHGPWDPLAGSSGRRRTVSCGDVWRVGAAWGHMAGGVGHGNLWRVCGRPFGPFGPWTHGEASGPTPPRRGLSGVAARRHCDAEWSPNNAWAHLPGNQGGDRSSSPLI